MAHSMSNSSIGESPSPVILKRKRSKRHRTLALPPATAWSDSSDTTEEDQDMAYCLMLLAQGPSVPFNEVATSTPSRTAEPATTLPVLYRCKSCNKCFTSFQALGGHRASHKKPAVTNSVNKVDPGSVEKPIASSSSSAGGGKKRTHQCSVCGAEFSSGQALGGHMRRHRPALLSQNNMETDARPKKVLLLDLNLPAPTDDEPGKEDGDSRFQVFKY